MESEVKVKRHRKSKRHSRSIVRDFSFEIFIVILFLFGVFLIFEQMEVKAVIFQSILSFIHSISQGFSDFLGAILGTLSDVEISDVVGSIMIIIAFLLLTARARQKAIIRYGDLTVCPECHSDLIHVHRNTLQRVTGTILRLKIRRYKCKQCGFDGIRIRPLNAGR